MASSGPPSSVKSGPADASGTPTPSEASVTQSSTASEQTPGPSSEKSGHTFKVPFRHPRRGGSKPKEVKETLNAHSEYSTDENDGTAQHRINQYLIGQEIGRGSFGAVHLATDQYGQEFAVKEFSKSRLRKRAQSNLLRRPSRRLRRPGTQIAAGEGFNSPLHRHGSLPDSEDQALDLIKEEIAIMKKLNHPNVVGLIEVLDDPEEDSLYMVLEMCKKGVVMNVGLDNPADPYDDETCRSYFRDMCLGLEYLHAQGIIHRDIKPDNCLVTAENAVKFVDFGVSEMFEKDTAMNTTKSAGSPAFMPPELCVARHGIPFEKTSVLDLYDSIRDDQLVIPDNIDPSMRDLLVRLLDKDPARRISMEEIREHPWVTKNGTDPMISRDENVSDIIEPPTEEEMNMAITGNMKRLLTVMNAARKFKQRLLAKRPELMDSILGGASRLVQPPSSIRSHIHSHSSRPQNDGANDESPIRRKPVPSAPGSGAQTPNTISGKDAVTAGSAASPAGTSGISSPIGVTSNTPPPPSQQQSEQQRQQHRDSFSQHGGSPSDGRKGQAHDPLEDTLFLNVGVGGDSNVGAATASTAAPDIVVVSESPGAVSINVYEQAYQEEVDRILREREQDATDRSLTRRPTLFLTRRVEDVRSIRENVNITAREHMKNAGEAGMVGLAKVVTKAQNAVDQADEQRAQQGKPGIAETVMRAKESARAAVAEYRPRSSTAKTDATSAEGSEEV